MAQGFIHGVETISIDTGARTVTEVKSGVIGLVGIAPTEFGKNVCTLVTGDASAAQFGGMVPGFDIPQSLNHILAQGSGAILVVNVFDIATHTVAITDEAKTVINGGFKLAYPPIGALTIKDNAGAATTYAAGTDYTIDQFGNFKVIGTAIPNATALRISYKRLDPATVTTAHIIGSVDGSGNKTGMKAWEDAFTQFGFSPRILLAPGRSGTKTIADALIAEGEKLRAVAILDSSVGATVSTVISDRGDATKAFGTSSTRAILAYPHVKAYDESKDTGVEGVDTDSVFPYSPFMAGVISATDNEFGYWWSPSNKNLSGLTGLERKYSSTTSDPNSDINLLNAAGITAVFNSFGTGYRVWGNRSAAYPTNTHVKNFIALQRIADIVHDSLELASLQFIDQPGTQAAIDDVRETGNGFVRTLIGRGALIEGSHVEFNLDDNPVTNLANGHYTYRLIFMGPTPMERITFKSMVDINLLKSLK